MSLRLFIGLKIKEDALNHLLLVRNSLMERYEKPKWEADEKLHLTIRFIGEVELITKNRISEVFSNYSELLLDKFSFTHFLSFPNKLNPRVLCVGLKVDEELYRIVENINSSLSTLGLPKEDKKFKPHITLWRIKNNMNREILETFWNYKFNSHFFGFSEIALIQSKLFATGSEYKDLINYKVKNIG